MKVTQLLDVTPQELTNIICKELVKLIRDSKAQTELPEKPISVKELAEFLGKNKQTIYNWVKKGTIPCHEIDGTLFFLHSEIIKEHFTNPKPSVKIDIELAEKYAPNFQK
tara:strand:- start:77 stop:406 length:330 start_codon:yes stop_codon:yes gene_type:complete